MRMNRCLHLIVAAGVGFFITTVQAVSPGNAADKSTVDAARQARIDKIAVWSKKNTIQSPEAQVKEAAKTEALQKTMSLGAGSKDWEPSNPHWRPVYSRVYADIQADLEALINERKGELTKFVNESLADATSNEDVDAMVKYADSPEGARYWQLSNEVALAVTNAVTNISRGNIRKQKELPSDQVLKSRQQVILASFSGRSMLESVELMQKEKPDPSTGGTIGTVFGIVMLTEGDEFDRLAKEYAKDISAFEKFNDSPLGKRQIENITKANFAAIPKIVEFTEELEVRVKRHEVEWMQVYVGELSGPKTTFAGGRNWIPLTAPDKYPVLFIDYDHIEVGSSPMATLMFMYDKAVAIGNAKYSSQIVQYDINCASGTMKPNKVTYVDESETVVRVIGKGDIDKQYDRRGLQDLNVTDSHLGSICFFHDYGFKVPNVSHEEQWIDWISTDKRDHLILAAPAKKTTTNGVVQVKLLYKKVQARDIWGRKSNTTIYIIAYDCKSTRLFSVAGMVYDLQGKPIAGGLYIGNTANLDVDANIKEFSGACPNDTSSLQDLKIIPDRNDEVAAFIGALQKGNIDYVKTYLAAHPKAVNEQLRADEPKAPLDMATDFNRLDLVSYLIAMGADVNRTDPKGVTAMHRAAYFNFPDMVTLLIKNGAKTEVRDDHHRTPLYYAAERGSASSAAALVEGGADVDSHNNQDIPRAPGKDQEEVPPLSWAIEEGHKDVALVLLQHGANIAIVDHFYYTPLDYAVLKPGWSDMVRMLLDQGAQCEAVRNSSAVVDKTRDPESLHLVMDCVKQRTGTLPDLSSALGLAAGRGDNDFIKVLIQAGADVNGRSRIFGAPAIMTAVQSPTPEATIALLVNSGANVNITDLNGGTVLHNLAFKYQPSTEKIIDFLLAHGADINAAITPPNASVQFRDTGYTPLHIAAGNGQLEIARILLARGAKINALTNFKVTPLVWAVQNKHLDMVKSLLDQGAMVNAPDEKQPTPLEMAARSGEVDMVRVLLDKRAEVNHPSLQPIGNTWSTPLSSAIEAGNSDIAGLLVNKGADVNATDLQGRLPLNIAVKNNRLDLAKILVEHHANPNLKDKQGYSASMLAADQVMRDLLSGGSHESESKIVEIDTRKVCTKVTSLENSGKLKDEETPLAGSGEYVGSPNDDWDMYEVSDKSQIQLGGQRYIVGRQDVNLVYVSYLDKDNVENLICTFETKGQTVSVQSLTARVLMAAEKQAQNPVSYALKRPGTKDLEAILDGIATKPALSFLKGPDGLSALLYKAINEKRMDALKILLDRGANPNPSKDKLDTTPAHPKITPITTALQAMGSFSRGDTTPLYEAAGSGNQEAVRLLLEYGADPNIGAVYGAWYAPLDPPARHQDKLMLEQLLKHGADPSSLGQFGVMQIVQYRKNEMLSLLFDYGMRLESVNYTPSSFEAYAIQQGNPDAGKIALAIDLKKQESDCNSAPSETMPESCLPRELRSAEVELSRRYKEAMFGTSQDKQQDLLNSQRKWIRQRNAVCHLTREPATRDGWLSYVLTDHNTARCVLEQTRRRAAFFAKNVQ